MTNDPGNGSLWSVMVELQNDALRALDSLKRDDTPYARRSAVRAYGAAVEAVSATITDLALHHLPGSGHRFQSKDFAKRRREDASAHTMRVFAQAASVVGASYLTVKGPGWDAFNRSRLVRNGLMHPKSRADVDVTDAQLEDTGDALRWFLGAQSHVLGVIAEAMGFVPPK